MASNEPSIVGSEKGATPIGVGDTDDGSGSSDPPSLHEWSQRIGDLLQHGTDEDGVEAAVSERQTMEVAADQLNWRWSGIKIDTDDHARGIDGVGEPCGHRAGSAAKINQTMSGPNVWKEERGDRVNGPACVRRTVPRPQELLVDDSHVAHGTIVVLGNDAYYGALGPSDSPTGSAALIRYELVVETDDEHEVERLSDELERIAFRSTFQSGQKEPCRLPCFLTVFYLDDEDDRGYRLPPGVQSWSIGWGCREVNGATTRTPSYGSRRGCRA